MQQVDFNFTSLVISLTMCCILPTLALFVFAFFALRNATRLLAPGMAPNAVELNKQFESLKSAHPNLTTEQLAQRIIRQQSVKSGLIGAVTSVGGLPILPFGLAADAYASTRIQSSTLYFLSRLYNTQTPNIPKPVLTLAQAIGLNAKIDPHLLMAEGGKRVFNAIMKRVMLILSEKAAAKIVPIIGLIIGFVVNYATTQAISTTAMRYYAARSRAALNDPSAKALPKPSSN